MQSPQIQTTKLPGEMNFLEFITHGHEELLHATLIVDFFTPLSKVDMKLFYIFIEEFHPKIIEKYNLLQSNEIFTRALDHCSYNTPEMAESNEEEIKGLSHNFWKAFLAQLSEENIKKNKQLLLENLNSTEHLYYNVLSSINSFFDYLSSSHIEDIPSSYFSYAKKVFLQLNLEKTLELINKNIDKDISCVSDLNGFLGTVGLLNKSVLFLSEEENESLSIQLLKNYTTLQKYMPEGQKNSFVSYIRSTSLNFWSPKVRSACPKIKFDSIFEATIMDYNILSHIKGAHIEFSKFIIEKIDFYISNPDNLKKPLAKPGFSYSVPNLTKVQATKMDYFNKIFAIKLADHNSTNIMIERVANVIESDIKKAQLLAGFFNDEIHVYLKRNKFETKEKGLSAILQYCEKNIKKYKTVENILDRYKKQIVQVEQQYISEALMGNLSGEPNMVNTTAKKHKI